MHRSVSGSWSWSIWKSVASCFIRLDVCTVGSFQPSSSDVPKIAVKNDAFAVGSWSAVASVRSRVCAKVDAIEYVAVRSHIVVFVSLLIYDGDLAIRRSILVCTASSRCSWVKLSTWAYSAYRRILLTMVLYIVIFISLVSSWDLHILPRFCIA